MIQMILSHINNVFQTIAYGPLLTSVDQIIE